MVTFSFGNINITWTALVVIRNAKTEFRKLKLSCFNMNAIVL